MRVNELSSQLISSDNSHKSVISEKMDEISQLWEDLKELTSARHEALNGAKQVHVFDKNADETISWIGEKEAEMCTDESGMDLETIQSLLERQQGLERDLAAIQDQVSAVEKEAGVLSELFPDASAHIQSKREYLVQVMNNVVLLSQEREDKLQQNQKIQRYFDDYRELMAWSSEVIAKITSPDLASDLAGAETLISRHKETRSEIDARLGLFNRFESSGKDLVNAGHFMSTEILDKISNLTTRKSKMLECWKLVEELLKKHKDFEGTVLAKEEDLQLVHRITMIEKNFQVLREREEEARQEEVKRKEQERLDGVKRKEQERITNERRRENERR